jgi:membrane protease YdiL (CAAX protease family)
MPWLRYRKFLDWVMRPLWVVSVYFGFVFVGGALIAPWIYKLVHALGGLFPWVEPLASKPFPRFVNRSFLILAVAGLLPFLRAADLRSWRAIGLNTRADAKGQIARGFALGLVSLALVVAVTLSAGARHLSPGSNGWSYVIQIAKAGATALVVAPLEELFFRGALFGTLRKTFHWTMALALSSAIYALLHFLEKPEWAGPVGWSSGLSVLLGMIRGFVEMRKLLPGFLNLTLAGLILGLAYQRLGSLYFSIGLHAGWIFWVKTYGFITQDLVTNQPWFFGTGRLIDGWLAFMVLIGVFLFVHRSLVVDEFPSAWKERQILI